MKYAGEVIELMSAFPGREFRMIQLVKYINPKADTRARQAIRIGVARVIAGLVETGSVKGLPTSAGRGGYSLYRWI